MFDMDMGYPCDHLVRYFCALLETPTPKVYAINLLFPLPPAGTVVGFTQVQGAQATFLASQFQLFLNEDTYPAADFTQLGQKLVRVQDSNPSVDVSPPEYPPNDFEVSHAVDPQYCPKCKGQTPFG